MNVALKVLKVLREQKEHRVLREQKEHRVLTDRTDRLDLRVLRVLQEVENNYLLNVLMFSFCLISAMARLMLLLD